MPDENNPADGTVAAVLDWVGEDPARISAALVAESAKDEPRSSLIDSLTARLPAEEGPPTLDAATALVTGGEEAPTDDYPERPFMDAVSDEERQRLVDLGFAEESADGFVVTAPGTVVQR